jgi:hypothetical protein
MEVFVSNKIFLWMKFKASRSLIQSNAPFKTFLSEAVEEESELILVNTVKMNYKLSLDLIQKNSPKGIC